MAGLSTKPRESPVLFGRPASLIGVLTEAAPSAQVSNAPAIILLNAGIVHRVGPNRLYVQLARALAAAGFTSLRFDQAGIGDSPNRADAPSPLASSLADIRDAVDWLTANKQVRSVILLGLCAGADHAVIYAHSDRRVVGMVLLDPSIPRTRTFHLNEFRRRLSRLVHQRPGETLTSIANLVHRNFGGSDSHLNRAAREGDGAPDEGDPEVAIESTLDDDAVREMFEQHYRQCVLADVKMLALFTGGVPSQHNYRAQLIDAFPGVHFGDELTLEHMPQSDHTFTTAANRVLLQRKLLDWLTQTSFTACSSGSTYFVAAECPSKSCARPEPRA